MHAINKGCLDQMVTSREKKKKRKKEMNEKQRLERRRIMNGKVIDS